MKSQIQITEIRMENFKISMDLGKSIHGKYTNILRNTNGEFTHKHYLHKKENAPDNGPSKAVGQRTTPLQQHAATPLGDGGHQEQRPPTTPLVRTTASRIRGTRVYIPQPRV
ncbi:hypothetical protein QAD02_021640 [Eretmocerus hayati]|uniref:Uncharacterized protein n=1 Tax=Eretmocerus hayati TaxID=131215 RepID=A0ACC2PR16_9HYME|nr:hypothetical protein QAD02_021640 [Eretmocerus hayati]